ncbi:MAG TPA: TonB-dependent receptor [Vicinamibacterales bacterium]|nr:TonB-dependent receptor [Vicinamibacterales bacterium]
MKLVDSAIGAAMIMALFGATQVAAEEITPESQPSEPAPPTVAVDAPAQEATDPTTPEQPQSRIMEEIIVTAQKREENLQDVPISVSAFSAESLDARGIQDPKDLPLATPGLTVTEFAGFVMTYLRGIGSDAFLAADPSIALYIDGVYFPFAHGQAQNFGAIERIEVLKGPQGTLFGRNAVGGAINIVSHSPQFDEPSVSVQTSFAEYGTKNTRVETNLPLADNFAVLVSGIYNERETYWTKSTVNGHPLPDEVVKGFKVRARWMPVDYLDITLSGFRIQQSGIGTDFALNSEPQHLFGATVVPQTGRNGSIDAPAFFELANNVFYGSGKLDLEPFDVKALGSYQKIKTDSLYDFDGSAEPLVFFHPRQFARIKTAELQFLSKDTSWGSDWLTWVGGYYYFKGLQGLKPVTFGVAGTVLDGLNGLLENFGVPPLLAQDGVLSAYGILDTISHSGYAQGTAKITDWFSLTLGARYQNEKRVMVRSGGTATFTGFGEEIPYQNYTGEDTTKSFVPKVSLDFRPWEDGLVYFSFSQAVKSSTFNTINFLPLDTPEKVKPEKFDAYEIGLKTTLFDGTTRVNTAVFDYEMKDLQVLFVSLLAGGALTFENAPKARSRGIDVDITSELFPSALPGLVLTLTGAYVDAKFLDYPNAKGYTDAGVYVQNEDFSGKRIVRSPKYSGTVGLSQTLAAPGGSLEIGGEYYYNGGFFYLAQNTSFNEEKPYGVLGARVSYMYEPWGLRATVFGTNILDKKYNVSRFPNDFGGLDALAPPVIYGLRLNWDFGT